MGHLRSILGLWAILVATIPMPCQASESIQTISVTPDATLSFIVNASTNKPKHVLILMVGGAGNINLVKTENGYRYANGNFLMRARPLLADQEFVTISPDVPSDLTGTGYSDEFRNSERHLGDIQKLIGYIHEQYPSADIYLVATSQGTVSSGVLALKLGNQIAGVIHTATFSAMSIRAGAPLWNLPYDQVKSRQVFIHHTDDGCKWTLFGPLETIAKKNKIELIAISEGDAGSGDPCQAFTHHGFLGVESQVTGKIKDWINSASRHERSPQ